MYCNRSIGNIKNNFQTPYSAGPEECNISFHLIGGAVSVLQSVQDHLREVRTEEM